MSLNNIIETFERPAEMASAFSSGAFAVVVIVKDLIYLLARDFNCFIVSAGRISPRRLWPLTGKHKKNIIIKYILKILKYCVTQLHKVPHPRPAN